jgi:hypothetical protein
MELGFDARSVGEMALVGEIACDIADDCGDGLAEGTAVAYEQHAGVLARAILVDQSAYEWFNAVADVAVAFALLEAGMDFASGPLLFDAIVFVDVIVVGAAFVNANVIFDQGGLDFVRNLQYLRDELS